MFDNLASALPHIRAGRIRALGVTSARAHAQAPEIPTAAEAANLPGFEAVGWAGLIAPARTPRPSSIGWPRKRWPSCAAPRPASASSNSVPRRAAGAAGLRTLHPRQIAEVARRGAGGQRAAGLIALAGAPTMAPRPRPTYAVSLSCGAGSSSVRSPSRNAAVPGTAPPPAP